MVSSITANHRVLQSYLGNNPKVDSAVLPATQPVGMAAEQNNTESVQVNVSLAARAKQALRTSFTSYQQQQAETKKAKARERVAEVKKRIDELKRLLTLFGAMAPKALLRELQQLAGELKSAAKELKEGWGSSSPTGGANAENVLETDAAAPEITDDSLNFAAADEQADEQLTEGAPDETRAQQQASAEDLAADAEDDGSRESTPTAASTTESTPAITSFLQHTEKEQSKQQRQEDQRLLQETVQELKLLFNRLKAMLQQEDRDQDTEKQLDKISQQLTDTNNIAGQLTLSIEASMPTVNIAVSV